jgi:5-formyltetrahydrofolate cyclo-ligase
MPLTKHDIRQEALNIRRAISSADKVQATAHAANILEGANIIKNNSVIAGYVPTKSEFDVLPLLHSFPNIALPCITQKDTAMIFRHYIEGDRLEQNPLFNFMQPLDTSPIVTPDIIFVPLVAFDRRGARLGMGGGYYDRTLAAGNFKTIGIAFAACEVEKIPTEPHDIYMDAILTEKELIRISL